MLRHKADTVDLLILGAGWTSTFLIPQLEREKITHGETTTTGRDDTIPFKFNPDSSDLGPYKRLPSAETVLVTFPLLGTGQSKHITSLYRRIHGDKNNWIQLGSTGIYNQIPGWNTEDSAYDTSDSRAIAEDELLSLHGCVLNLAGLYGGTRKPANWITRIAKSKEDVKKRNAVHFIHGDDVSRAIIATHKNFTRGKRWIIADRRVYDWWDLILSFSSLAEGEGDGEGMGEEEKEGKLRFGKWVSELMVEQDVRALPREMGDLGRKLDSRGFWTHHGISPGHRRLA